ncbi:hypothetical protein SUGI_0917400 [Cryptomeria japonica]|uniref:U-box domain-containing protein 52 n=1 Tax=Cryptomeria japonica TaxID=3369 RepID=UPI002414727D|nr:U-box domain-containing protein 52 [Cryptomeria japonica]GLJ44008.1 hypothetical protein SUGI_0917400 [Cryptomeria japonica]
MDFSPFFPTQTSSLEPVKTVGTKQYEDERGVEVNSGAAISPRASGWYAQVKEHMKLMKTSEHEKEFKFASASPSPPPLSFPRTSRWYAQPTEHMIMMKTSEDERRLEATSSFSSPSSSFHYDSIATVCVGKDENSKNALIWALDHLVCEGDTIQILHVRDPIIANSWGQDTAVFSDKYRKQRDSKTAEILQPYQYMCDSNKVRAEILVLDESSVAIAIVKYISKANIRKIVLGATSRNRISRIIKPPDISTRVATLAPKFCQVYVISKHQHISFQSSVYIDPKSNIYDSQSNSSFSKVSDSSYSGSLQDENRPRGSVEVEAWQGNIFLTESPCQPYQGLSFGNPTMSSIAMEKGCSELQPYKENRVKSSCVKDQVSIASIETEPSRSGSFKEPPQFIGTPNAGQTKVNDLKRRLGNILKLPKSTEVSNPNNQSFIRADNQSLQDYLLRPESYHGISDPETQYSEIDKEEITFPLKRKSFSNINETRLREFRSLISEVNEGVHKDNQSLGKYNLEARQYNRDSTGLQASPPRHSDFSFSAGRSAKENEDLFEISSPDIKSGMLWKTSKGETLSATSKTVQSLEDPPDISKFHSSTKSLNFDNESFQLNNNLSLQDRFSSPDLSHDNQNSNELNSNLAESEPSEETQFFRHTRKTKTAEPSSLLLQVTEGFNKNFQFFGSPKTKGKQNYKKDVETGPRPAEHLRISSSAEISSDESEGFFEILLSDFEAATPRIISTDEKLGIASKSSDSDTLNIEMREIELDEPSSLQKVHLDPSSTGFIEDIDSEVEKLKIQIQRILQMYNEEVKRKWKQL